MEDKGKQERMKEKCMQGKKKKKKHVKAKEVQRPDSSLEKKLGEKSVAVSENAPRKENLEVVKRNEILSKEKEAEVSKENKEINWYDMIINVKNALEAQKRRMEEAEKEVSENRQTIGILQMEKEALKAELCKANDEKRITMDENEEKALKLSGKIQMLENEKRELEVTVCETNKKAIEMMKRILTQKMILKADKTAVEDENKKKVLELLQRIELLEKEKMDLEAEKRSMIDENDKKVLNLVNRIQVLEKENKRILNEKKGLESEKRIMEYEDKKKILELVQNIEVLKKKKNNEMEERVSQVNKEKTEEIKKILNEKMVLEADKRTMESRVCELHKEKSEEINRILEEKMTLETEKRNGEIEHKKKIVELTDKIGILERDKQMIEAKVMKKELVIRVEYVPVSYYDAGLSTTPSQFEGKQSAGSTGSSSQNNSTNDDDNVYERTPCKRKRHFTKELSESTDEEAGLSKRRETVPCEKNREMIWKVEEDLLNAFDVDTELCLKAICALYRQRKTVADPVHNSQVIALAEYMIWDDPEGRMTRTVAELEELESDAVVVSVQIAKKYYKQVYEIYKNNEDPFFQ